MPTGFTESALIDIPVYVAEKLAEALSFSFLHYRPSNLEQALTTLPTGWVDWGPGFESVSGMGRDATETLAIFLAVTVITSDRTDAAVEAHRRYVGQIVRWVRNKRRTKEAETGLAIRRMAVESLDWLELEEIEGVNLHGRIIQAGGVLVRLEFYDAR